MCLGCVLVRSGVFRCVLLCLGAFGCFGVRRGIVGWIGVCLDAFRCVRVREVRWGSGVLGWSGLGKGVSEFQQYRRIINLERGLRPVSEGQRNS